jgi:hypothetical protein
MAPSSDFALRAAKIVKRLPPTQEKKCGMPGEISMVFLESHGLINNIDSKAKCRHLQNLPVKEL